MDLTVIRDYKIKATPGVMFVQGEQFCNTLEPKRCIPEGKYQVHLTYSPRFKRIMPLVLPVVGFEGIRIHWGSFIKDTQGCPLVGYDKGYDANGIDAVFRSKVCFNELFRWLERANLDQEIFLNIESGFERKA